ncbi:inactive 2-oxoglutarate-dependent dioxygenase AOP2 [Pyrus ussuriensis x Pyrus communis]|uniref:2-oxoglutarate-dependent dioxygenase DAO n=1 Tax=Pyrus ussuriensis x Pyrus communis TaxID=2448454 RepID=A0A5N5FGH8_9ROSA|nr:inactive 2-oxoglutarate-dependent dioxygenase AOP2 [Pyrus ussuriensis x Pyrus communis]
MGSLAPPKLPTINFSAEGLKPGSSSWLSTAKQVRFALEEYGFFVAQYDQISPELQNNIFGQAADLFEVPVENKVKNVGEQPYHGYIGPNPFMPLYESLCIDNVTSPQATHKFKNLMWPAGKKNFCETTDSFGQLLGDLERTVGQMLFDSFGVGNEYESVANCNSHLLRFIKYEVPEDTDTTLRFPMHTDNSFTTIVVQHDVSGLEVKTKEGDWINIESVPSRFLFMAADGLQMWSNDRIKACQHRVKHCGDKTRYSLGLFTFNNGVLQVPKELVDDEHPLLYNPCDSRGYTRFHASAESKKAASRIKAYCGIKVEN